MVGARAQRQEIHSKLLSLSLEPSEQVRNLGVILDLELDFSNHITSITKTAFYHLKNISTIKSILSQSDAEKLFHAFISLDDCNYCYYYYSGAADQIVVSWGELETTENDVQMFSKKYDPNATFGDTIINGKKIIKFLQASIHL